MSEERAKYLKRKSRYKKSVLLVRIIFIVGFFGLWEFLANLGIIDIFIISSPSRIISTLLGLFYNGLLYHLLVTLFETLFGFIVGIILGILLATLLWWFPFISRVLEPILVVLNSLPKIALGPVIIILVGAGTSAIIFMAIAISLIITVLELQNGFKNTDKDLIKMARTFSASRTQIYTLIVFTSNLDTLFNSMKVNIGLSLVGVIAGEFLVSKAGLGYLIVYGCQVFQLNLVMASVLILTIMASFLYETLIIVEKWVLKRH